MLWGRAHALHGAASAWLPMIAPLLVLGIGQCGGGTGGGSGGY
ncbi:MAG TPA: hypothetical protein VFA49_14675 [Chloroflexota bacterium]|nr:hypothetical protein [Chloroflexota bacterium]